jgi:hypothetical protein
MSNICSTFAAAKENGVKNMDDYHADNATSTCQEVSGAALFDGPVGRPKNS